MVPVKPPPPPPPLKDKEGAVQRYLDSLVRASRELLRKDFAPAVRYQGLELTLHLLRLRRDELLLKDLSAFGDVSGLRPGLYGIKDILRDFNLGRESFSCRAVFMEKLNKRVSAVRTGGKGSMRRMKKVVQKTFKEAAKEEKKSQSFSTFEECGQGNNDHEQNAVQGTVIGDFGGPTESVDEGKLGILGAMSRVELKDRLLLMEHNILSEAFVTAASFPRAPDMDHLLTSLLSTLNKIWTLSEWKTKYMNHMYHLLDLFLDDEFRRTVYLLVKSFEEVVNRIVEHAGVQEYSLPTDYTIPKLILAIILRLLNCIQRIWEEPITYDLSGIKSEDMISIVKSGKLLDIVEDKMPHDAETWSLGIRKTGYKVIGLCAKVEGAFYGLLDSSSIINVLMENVGSLEFNYMGKLIQLVVIPFVGNCPHECWDKWMVKLLEPVFLYCEDILCYAWFTFLHEGRAKVPLYLGSPCGPKQVVNQFEKELLLKFTRVVSDLLGVLASERLNSGLSLSKSRIKADVQDLKFISSSSIIGYLLLHDCFGRLSMYLFGCLVDYQAAEKALPFCHALIRLSITINHEGLKQFVLNEMLPTILLLLDHDLKSEITKLSCSLNSTTNGDAMNNVTNLCQEIYEIYIDKQVREGGSEGTKTMPVRFNEWLAKELENLRTCASGEEAPEHFPQDVKWNWEFNEEFKRYLPAYMDMLEEVDKMDDCLKDNYLDNGILLEKLKPEFKSRHGINNYLHPYLQTMTNMLKRKMPVVYYRRCTEWISEHLVKLIALEPYIKHTDSWDNVMGRLEGICEPQTDFLHCDPGRAVDIFCHKILSYWEPQFHPLIREGHMEQLKTIAQKLSLAEGSTQFEPLEPHPDDFLEHLQPYAKMYIKRKKEESTYNQVKEQAHLHEEFDKHLASGTLDHLIIEFSSSKDSIDHIVAASDIKRGPFATLRHDLIEMSFERRMADIIKWENEISSYFQCMTSLLESEEMKNEIGSLMDALNEEGFFRVDDASIVWGKKIFSDLVDKFDKLVFPGHCVNRCLVIRGIMEYQRILQMKDVDCQRALRIVASITDYLWEEYLEEFWVDTRHYKHEIYDMLEQPVNKVFLSHGAPQRRYG